MSTKIIEGIYQILVPIPNNPLGNTNVYLVKGVKGHVLIDAGWNDEYAFMKLTQELKEMGIGFKDIGQILVTHAHADHYGLVPQLRELTGAKVLMHHRDEEIFHTRYAVTDEFARQSEDWFRANGVPPHESSIRMPFGGGHPSMKHLEPDIKLNGGETIDTGLFQLQVIWTPGHSPGHICLYDARDKIFFSGDHILPVITPNIGLPPHAKTNPLGDFIKSLSELKKLDVKIVLPAHEAIFYDLGKRIDEIIHHHEVRKAEIMRAFDSVDLTAYQLSNVITWMPEMGGVKFENLWAGDKRAAVSETLAHLRAMEVDGQIKSEVKQGITYYHRVK